MIKIYPSKKFYITISIASLITTLPYLVIFWMSDARKKLIHSISSSPLEYPTIFALIIIILFLGYTSVRTFNVLHQRVIRITDDTISYIGREIELKNLDMEKIIESYNDFQKYYDTYPNDLLRLKIYDKNGHWLEIGKGTFSKEKIEEVYKILSKMFK